MKRQTVLTTLGLATALLVMKPHAIYTSTGYSGGTGIESDPYLISTPEQLNQLRIEVNGGMLTKILILNCHKILI